MLNLFRNIRRQRATELPESKSRRGFLGRLLALLGSGFVFPWSSYGAAGQPLPARQLRTATGGSLRADLLLHSGNIITLDGKPLPDGAVAVRGSNIVAVAESASLTSQLSPDTPTIDLEGRTLLPGFCDTHPHMDREGLKLLGGESLIGANSVAAIVERVAAAVAKAEPGQWIVFMPMGAPPFAYVNDPSMLQEGRYPNRHDLDEVAPDNPVFIRGVWGWWTQPPYPAIANTEAMRRCGVSAASADPYNIEIVRDRAGQPTGVFLESNRTSLLEFTLFQQVPRFSFEDRLESVRLGSQIYRGLGTTTAYEAHGLTPALMRAYREIDERGELAVRMSAPLSVPSSSMSRRELSTLLRQWAPAAGGRGLSSQNFRVSGVTLDYASPEIARPIAQNYPYTQWAGKFAQALTKAEFVEVGIEAAKQGMRLHFLIASAPPRYDVDQTLDMLEEIDRHAPLRDMRCVGFHMLKATPGQLKRIKELGLVVTFTPSFIYSQAAPLRLDKLGQSAFPIREVLDAGIPAVLGSDNVPPSMLFSAWSAIERWDALGERQIGESRLTREEVLRMLCQTPHYLNWEEDSRGKIAPGMAAELVVLDGDPLTCAIEELADLKPVLSMVDGRLHTNGL